MFKRYAKVLFLALLTLTVLFTTACGGGSSSSTVVDPVVETITSALSGSVDLSALGLSAPNKAPGDVTVNVGYYTGETFNSVGTATVSSTGTYEVSVNTPVVKNLVVKVLNQGTELPNGSNVIPYIKTGTVKVEKINDKTYKKVNIVKQAEKNNVEINIAEVLSRIPPTTLYKLNDTDIQAIAGAFIAVVAAEKAKVTETGLDTTSYEALKSKAFELSQTAIMWIETGEYDEETAWEIYEAELKAWALKNRFTREQYYAVLGAKNDMFAAVVTTDGSGGLIVDIPDTVEVIINQQLGAVDASDVAGGSLTGDTGENIITIVEKIEEKKAELAQLTVNELNNELDIIMHSVYALTEAVIAANEEIADRDINVDPLVDLTNRVIALSQMNLDEYEVKTQFDLLEIEFQKVTDILFGELLYYSFTIAPTHEAKMALMQKFFQMVSGGNDDIFETATEAVVASTTSALKNYLVYDEWYDGDSSDPANLRRELELMDSLFNYAGKSESSATEKYNELFGTSGFMNEVSEAYAAKFTQSFDFQVGDSVVSEIPATIFGWTGNSNALSNAMGKIFAYIFMFDIEMPMSLVDPAGMYQWRQNVMVKKLATPVTFTDLTETDGTPYKFNYKIVNAANGDLAGYGRLQTRDEMIADFANIEANYTAKNVQMHGDPGPTFAWQTFDPDNNWETNTWADFKSAIGVTDSIADYTERLWAMKYNEEDDCVIVTPVPAEEVFIQRWLEKPLELSGILIPAAGASITGDIQKFLDPYRMVMTGFWIDDEGGDNQYFSDFWATVKYDTTKGKYFLVHPNQAVDFPETPFAAPSNKNDRWVLDKFNAYIELNEEWARDYVEGKTFQFWGMLIENSKNDNGGINYTFIANEIREFTGGSNSWEMVATGIVVATETNPITKDLGNGSSSYYEYTIKDPIDSYMQFLKVYIPAADSTWMNVITWFDDMATNKNMITVGDPGPDFDDDMVTETIMATWNDQICPGMPYTVLDPTMNTTTLVAKTDYNGNAIEEPAFAKKEEFFGSWRDFRYVKILRIPESFLSGSYTSGSTPNFDAFYGALDTATQDFFKQNVTNYNINYIGWIVHEVNDSDTGALKSDITDGITATGALDHDGVTQIPEAFYVFNYMPDDQKIMSAFEGLDEDNFIEFSAIGQTGTEYYRGINAKIDKVNSAGDNGVSFDVYFAELQWADDNINITVNNKTIEILNWDKIASYCYGLINWMQPWDGSTNHNFFPNWMLKENPALTDVDNSATNVFLTPENHILVKDFDSNGNVLGRYKVGLEMYDDKLVFTNIWNEYPNNTGAFDVKDAWFNLDLVNFRSFSSIEKTADGHGTTAVAELNNIPFGTGEVKLRAFAGRLNVDDSANNNRVFVDIEIENQAANWGDMTGYLISFTINDAIEPISDFMFESGSNGLIANATAIPAANWTTPVVDYTQGYTAGLAVLPEFFGTAEVNFTTFSQEHFADAVTITKTASDYNAFFTKVPADEGSYYIKWWDADTDAVPHYVFDKWTLSYDVYSNRAFVNMIEFKEPDTPEVLATQDVTTATFDQQGDSTYYIPGGICIFDKQIADEMTNPDSTIAPYQAYLGDAYFGQDNMYTEMFKEANGVVRVELHWNMWYEYWDQGTQNWVQEFEEEQYNIRYQKQTDGSYTILSIKIIVREMDPQTGIWNDSHVVRFTH